MRSPPAPGQWHIGSGVPGSFLPALMSHTRSWRCGRDEPAVTEWLLFLADHESRHLRSLGDAMFRGPQHGNYRVDKTPCRP
jgi:hypothetical protein